MTTVSYKTALTAKHSWSNYTPDLLIDGNIQNKIKYLFFLINRENAAKIAAENQLSKILHNSINANEIHFCTELKKWMITLSKSDKSITDYFAYATPNMHDLKCNNETHTSDINIGSWWKKPSDRRKWNGKGYPKIVNPSDRHNITFQTLLQAYLGRLRELVTFTDFDINHIDQLTRIAVALRVRITSDNHPNEYPAVFKIHQIWNNANPGITPPAYLPFVRWGEPVPLITPSK
jgi:hypothetical protein